MDVAEELMAARLAPMKAPSPVSQTQAIDQANSPTMEHFETTDPAVADNETHYPKGLDHIMICVALTLALLMGGLDLGILATAIPTITNHFKSITDIGWYYSAYRLTGCAFQFFFGKVYQVFPVKTVFITSLIIFEAGSLLAGLAPTSRALILGRAVSGLGSAGVITGIFTIMAQSLPLRRRPLYGAVGGALETVAGVSAPLLGGVLTERLSWRWCFFINLPLGLVTVLVVYKYYKGPPITPQLRVQQQGLSQLTFKEKLVKLDLLGTAVFVPGVISLLLALQWGGSKYGWDNPRIIVLIILFALLISAFAWLQFRLQENATLPPRIICNRSILAGMLFCICTQAVLAIVDFYLPIYFQAVKGKTPSESGVLSLPLIMGLAVACLMGGSLTSAVGYYVPFMLLTSFITPLAAGLLTTLKVDGDASRLIVYQVLLGVGAGIGIQGPQSAAQTVLRPEDASIGISAIMFASGFGPTIFVSAAQTVFTKRLTADLELYAPGVNATSLASMGFADLTARLGPKNLANVVLGYDEAVAQTFYLPLALACLSILGSLAMEWQSVKKKRE